MKRIDVKQLTIDALAQALGTEYMEANPQLSDLASWNIADVGKVATAEGNVERYTHALLSLMAKMYIENREYVSDLPSLFVDSIDYGWFIERVKIDLLKVLDDNVYNLVSGKSYAEIEHTFYQPTVHVKIFNEAKPISIPVSIVTTQIKEAFRSLSDLERYIEGIRQAQHKTAQVIFDAYAHMLISDAVVVSAKATNTAVHLITDAVQDGVLPEVVEANEAMNNPDFVAYALKRIYNTRKYMSLLTNAFNNGSMVMQTPPDDNKLILLNDFVSTTRFSLKANTYNDKLLDVGKFDGISAWQAVSSASKKFDYDTLSTIKLSADESNKLGAGTSAIEVKNCIGLAFDRMAIGICPRETRVTSNYTACADFWNEFTHILANYVLDSDYAIVAFLLD